MLIMFFNGSILSRTLRGLRSSLCAVNLDQCIRPVAAFRTYSVGRKWRLQRRFNSRTHRLQQQTCSSDVGYTRPRKSLTWQMSPESQDFDRQTKLLAEDLDRIIDEYPTAIDEQFSISSLAVWRVEASISPQHHLEFAYVQLRSIFYALEASSLLSILSTHVRHQAKLPQALLNELYAAVDSKIDNFSGEQLAELLHCLASLEVPFLSDMLCVNCFTALQKKLEALNTTQLMSIIQSLGSLRKREVLPDSWSLDSFLSSLHALVAAKFESLSARQLVSYLHATSRLGLPASEALLEAFCSNDSKKLKGLTEEDLADLWASVAEGFTYFSRAPFIAAFEAVMAEKTETAPFSARSLLSLIQGYAKLRVKPSERFLEAWFRCAMSGKLAELSSRDLTVLIDSFVELKLEHEAFAEICGEVLQGNLADSMLAFAEREDDEHDEPSERFLDLWHKAAMVALPKLGGRELANVIYAYSCPRPRRDEPAPGFLSKFSEFAPSKFREMSVNQLLMILSGLKLILKYRCPSQGQVIQGEFMQRWYETASMKMTEFSAEDLSAVISAIGSLNLKPSVQFSDTFMASTLVKMEQFSARNIAESIKAIAELGINPNEAFMKRLCARVCELSFGPGHLLYLLRALKQWNYSCEDPLMEKLTAATLSAADGPGLSNEVAKEMLRLCFLLAAMYHGQYSPDIRLKSMNRLWTKYLDFILPRAEAGKV